MANELAINTPAPVQPNTAPASSNADSQAQGGGFVEALAEVLTAEAATADSSASIAQQSLVKTEDLESGEDLLDASVLFVDPQLLMQTLAQAKPSDVAFNASSDGARGAVALQSNRAALNALTTAQLLSVGDQDVLQGGALLDAGLQTAQGAGESSIDSKSDGKSGAENSAAALLSNSAAAHERVAEMRDRPVIRSHVGTAMWTEELAGKLTVMVGRGVQSASIQLSPEHLGPLEIRISVHNEQASVWFGATHAETRTALEQALPRLREMLASQGLNLSDAGVFREAPRQQGKQNPNAPFASRETEREFSVAAIGLRGIVDAYA